MALKDLLRNKLTKKQLALVPSSFDIIGSRDRAVAIIEIPDELRRKATLIAKTLMKHHKNVKTVFLKASERKGVYRLRKLKLITGDKNSLVTHAESGCKFLLDPKEVYFSPREGTERLRIASLIKPKEVVMVFFSGIGAFPIVIAKKAAPKKVIGIEINPDACRYFWKNIKLNKLENIQIVLGDVKEKSVTFYGACNRVIMPLPESATDYLGYAIRCLKNSGIIHLYCFSEENGVNRQVKKISAVCKNFKKRCSISAARVLPYGPGVYKYRFDITVQGNG